MRLDYLMPSVLEFGLKLIAISRHAMFLMRNITMKELKMVQRRRVAERETGERSELFSSLLLNNEHFSNVQLV